MSVTTVHLPQPLLILCGGLSRRMGTPKALLSHQGQSLIARLLDNALPHRPVWLAAADKHYAHTQGAIYLGDALPEHQGPLAAILPALQRAQQSGYQGLYVLACDTLLLPEAVIQTLNHAHTHPIWHTGLVALTDTQHMHPLLAHWSVHLSTPLQTYLAAGKRKVMDWLKEIPCHGVNMPVSWPQLANFNTPADFKHAMTILEQV